MHKKSNKEKRIFDTVMKQDFSQRSFLSSLGNSFDPNITDIRSLQSADICNYRFSDIQRQSIASQIGQSEGNRHLKLLLNRTHNTGREQAPTQISSGMLTLQRSSEGQKFSNTFTFKFVGQLGNYSSTSFDPNPYWTLREWVGKNLRVFSNYTSSESITNAIITKIKEIHYSIPVVNNRNYNYKIRVLATLNNYSVDVSLHNPEKHLSVATEAKIKATERRQHEIAIKGAHQTAEKKKLDESLADMKFIIGSSGKIELVSRPVWIIEQRRLQRMIRELVQDVIPWNYREFKRTYDSAGLIMRIGSAYSGKGVAGYRKPDYSFYWKAARIHQMEASKNLAVGNFVESEHHISMSYWCMNTIEQDWNNWYQDAGQGAGTVVEFLVPLKYAGMGASLFISGGTTAAVRGIGGLTAGAAQAGGFAMAFDWADQRGKIIAGSQEEFDAFRTAKIGVSAFFLNFIGGGLGSKISTLEWGKAIASRLSDKTPALAAKFPKIYKDIIAWIPNSVLQEIGIGILGKIDPGTFNRPEDVMKFIVEDPTFQNFIMLWGERYLRNKK